jgi:cytochrome c oxidase cbb3-type subunit III
MGEVARTSVVNPSQFVHRLRRGRLRFFLPLLSGSRRHVGRDRRLGVVVLVLGTVITRFVYESAASGNTEFPAPASGVIQTAAAQGRGGGGLGSAFPQRPAQDPAAVERGKALFGVSCGFCHGSDARGATTGPNLWRSSVVLMDQKGELIGEVIRNGRPDKGMPKVDLSAAQTVDVVAFLHSLPIGGRDPARMRPPSIVVGKAEEGEEYFKRTCASCHSTTGDLKGLASKYPDPRQLQQAWLMPGSGRGGGRGQPGPNQRYRPTVTVTLASGEKVEGTLNRIDDFAVSLTDASGANRTFERRGTTPPVDIRDPLEPHRTLVPSYRDADIHNLTAYLVTLK